MNGALSQFGKRGRHREVKFFVVGFRLSSLGVFSGSVHDLGAASSSVVCRLPDTRDGTGIVHQLSTALRRMQVERNKSDLGGQEGGASTWLGAISSSAFIGCRVCSLTPVDGRLGPGVGYAILCSK